MQKSKKDWQEDRKVKMEGGKVGRRGKRDKEKR